MSGIVGPNFELRDVLNFHLSGQWPITSRRPPAYQFKTRNANFCSSLRRNLPKTTARCLIFQQKHGAVVVKPLHGNGGKAIFKVEADGTNLSAITELFGQVWPEPFMVQPFIPEVAEGDKRIVLVDGEFAGAINRKPGAGEFRSNLAVGGSAEATALTPREEEICAALGPQLKARGLVFVGIDVIGGEWLTEINVTSPTGIVAIERFDGVDVSAMIWDAIEKKVGANG